MAPRKPKFQPPKKTKIIAICSPKGGTGKTTFAQNLLAQFAANGERVLGVDFDPQHTLTKWFQRREQSAESDDTIAMFDTLPAGLDEWQKVLEVANGYETVVLDILPGVDAHIAEVHGLCQSADLVIVPTGVTMSDLDSTGPWVAELTQMGFSTVVCMNRANRRETFFAAARAQLNKIGRLCPVEVRQLADAHAFSIDGLSASDKPRSKAYSDFAAVFDFVRREINRKL